MAARTIEETARELAAAHRAEDPDTLAVYLVPDPKGQEVRLIEVSASVDPVGDVLPFRLEPAPDKGIDYPVVILLLSPTDWEQLQRSELELPEGWRIDRSPLDVGSVDPGVSRDEMVEAVRESRRHEPSQEG
ncbi:MAG: hypothetical protein ACQEXJ_21035 [Myxococcota bacterium]